jgi:hypothetical protein
MTSGASANTAGSEAGTKVDQVILFEVRILNNLLPNNCYGFWTPLVKGVEGNNNNKGDNMRTTNELPPTECFQCGWVELENGVCTVCGEDNGEEKTKVWEAQILLDPDFHPNHCTLLDECEELSFLGEILSEECSVSYLKNRTSISLILESDESPAIIKERLLNGYDVGPWAWIDEDGVTVNIVPWS